MKPRRHLPLDMQRAEDEEEEYEGVDPDSQEAWDTRNSGGNVMSPGKNKVFFSLPASSYFSEIEIDVHGYVAPPSV